jgi:hypothetical protein
MTKKIAAAVFVLGSVAMLSPSAWAEKTPLSRSLTSRGFKKIAKKKGVTVYKHPRSAYIRLGAEGQINQPPEKVFKALLDYPNQKSYISRLSQVKVIKRTKKWLIVYQRLNLPVISDRDFTLFVKFGKTGNTRWITYRAVTNRGPKKRSGIVRVTLHRGSWQLKSINGGRSTFARYQMVMDLAGTFPLWLAKRGSGKALPKLFSNVGRMASTY